MTAASNDALLILRQADGVQWSLIPLPEDRGLKIAGVSNRIAIPAALGAFCVFVETLLNRAGLLVWDWRFWNWPNVYFIVLAYTLPFVAITWAYDNWTMKTKLRALAFFAVLDALAWIILVEWLGWI